MRGFPLLILITFIESVASICLERGVYFYSFKRLGFGDAMNLWLALAMGATYITGALSSHRFLSRLKEKHLFLACLVAQLGGHLTLALPWGPTGLFVLAAAVNFINGVKWPLVESYVSAGRSPAEASRAIGRFNLSWASAIPASLVVVGPIVASWPAGLFLLAAIMNLVSLLLVRPVPVQPAHLPSDHPERPDAGRLTRYGGLLLASRWLLLSSYSLLWVLAALMPRIFRDLGFSVRSSSGLAALADLARLGAFLGLSAWTGWHARASPIALSLALMPVGFFMVLFGPDLATVLAGEVLFGVVSGVVYFAALYYAMVVSNASVDAGGVHETVIGIGFVVGPAVGLLGEGLAPVLHGKVAGYLTGLCPLILACSIGALLALRKAHRMPAPEAG